MWYSCAHRGEGGGGGGHLSSSLDPSVSEELYFDLSTETTSCDVQRYIPHTDDPHQKVSMSELYIL